MKGNEKIIFVQERLNLRRFFAVHFKGETACERLPAGEKDLCSNNKKNQNDFKNRQNIL